MRRNITLSLDASLIREAEVLAARRGLSVSRMLTEQLEEIIRRDHRYEAAKHRALERLEQGLDLSWTPPTPRAQLDERQVLR